MNTRHFRSALHFVLGCIAILFATSTFAADVATHKVANGVDIYLGVLPSEMIVGHPSSHAEAEMHAGVPASEHNYHVVVALFDAVTGKRITDAQVEATVSELALAGATKKMERMHIADTISYGNYFRMPGTGIYRIRIRIRRLGVAQSIETEFEYQHARG